MLFQKPCTETALWKFKWNVIPKQKQIEVIIHRPSILNKNMHSRVFSAYAAHVAFVHLFFGVNECAVSTVYISGTQAMDHFEHYFRDAIFASLSYEKQVIFFSVNMKHIILLIV